MDDLRYPIGKYQPPAVITSRLRQQWISEIADAPSRVREAVADLTEAQLDTPYRPGGWTVRQVVHHIPDSHLNAYIRFKWTLTEDNPTIKAYDEKRWAELPEARSIDPAISLALLESLHQRWVNMLRRMEDADFERSFLHPELEGPQRLDIYLGLYAWHGKHHTAHITSLRNRNGW